MEKAKINLSFLLGVHSGHNSSVAVLENAALRFAIQEERLTRIKNQGDWPTQGLVESFRSLPEMANSSGELRCGYGWRHMARKDYWRPDDLIAGYGDDSLGGPIGRLTQAIRTTRTVSEVIDERRAVQRAESIKAISGLSDVKVDRLDHHHCHAAAAYFGWGLMDRKVLVITCDGEGDGICASVNVASHGRIDRIAAVHSKDSVGRLYANVTYWLGMMPLEHEYKVMGLAPYSQNSREAYAIADDFEELFEFDNKNPLIWRRRNCPPMRQAAGFLANFLRRKRFDHVASGLQIFLERWLVRWITASIAETGINKVALSGGVFMNVKANQKILEIPELEELFIFPSCGDESNAIGSAMAQYRTLTGENPRPLDHVYVGPEYSNDQVESAISEYQFAHKITCQQPGDIELTAAELLADGNIVGRFKGKMEFGARALGNRSILANPSDDRVSRVINEMIKNRDFWMPFAPSVLAERSDEYFVKPKDMKTPYMMIIFDTKKEKRGKIAAALHPYDWTARPQEVLMEWNPEYYSLLKHFEAITGEAVVLNTSYNLHGEPIVCSPLDALRTFDVSGLRYLAIGDFLLAKE